MTDIYKPQVQAALPTYELHTLGWKAFQQLCATITGDIWGQTVQSFLDSNDGGRDGAFYGIWKPNKGEVYEGSFTVQCKFTTKPHQSLHLSSLKDELIKAKALAARKLSDNYFLFTNKSLSAINDAEIRTAYEAISGIKTCTIIGAERISEIIRESPRLRMLVPRIYGLGDLSTIIDQRAIDQSKEILSSLGDDLQKFVMTDAYRRSARALISRGFVLLLGEPACGKSAIATALSMGALDEWRCSTFKIRNAAEFIAHSNPHDNKQCFWADDVFGATQLDIDSVIEWNGTLAHLGAAIKRGAKVVFTSRDYIYRNARSFLKESAFPTLFDSQVIIRVEDITLEERRQILYNHMRLGTQPRKFKSAIKPFLEGVAANSSFKPEFARRLGNPVFTKRLALSKGRLAEFVERPLEFLQEVIRTLDRPSRSAIALVFMRNGSLESPLSLSDEEEGALSNLGGTKAEVLSALSALKGSLLVHVAESGRVWWRFKHPTIRDAFADYVAQDREMMDIYLKGTPLRQMFSEITCGDTGFAGVKVVVPKDRYALVAARIKSEFSSGRDARSDIYSFLARRCTKEFLVELLRVEPKVISSLAVGAYLYVVSDVALIVRLHLFGLLPEKDRLRHIQDIRRVVLDTPDSGFTDAGVRSLFKQAEYEELVADVRTSILSDLQETLDNWRFNEPADGEYDDYYEMLRSALDEFEKLFPDDLEVSRQLNGAINAIETRLADISSETPEDDRDPDDYEWGASQAIRSDSRSVFDDVDE